ncbi:hypothetical protein QEN19_002782 [Hanseniaspora menglaensis]
MSNFFEVESLCPYFGNDEHDLPFQSGQLITVTNVENEEWFRGEYLDSETNVLKQGIFPQNHVKKLNYDESDAYLTLNEPAEETIETLQKEQVNSVDNEQTLGKAEATPNEDQFAPEMSLRERIAFMLMQQQDSKVVLPKPITKKIEIADETVSEAVDNVTPINYDKLDNELTPEYENNTADKEISRKQNLAERMARLSGAGRAGGGFNPFGTPLPVKTAKVEENHINQQEELGQKNDASSKPQMQFNIMTGEVMDMDQFNSKILHKTTTVENKNDVISGEISSDNEETRDLKDINFKYEPTQKKSKEEVKTEDADADQTELEHVNFEEKSVHEKDNLSLESPKLFESEKDAFVAEQSELVKELHRCQAKSESEKEAPSPETVSYSLETNLNNETFSKKKTEPPTETKLPSPQTPFSIAASPPVSLSSEIINDDRSKNLERTLDTFIPEKHIPDFPPPIPRNFSNDSKAQPTISKPNASDLSPPIPLNAIPNAVDLSPPIPEFVPTAVISNIINNQKEIELPKHVDQATEYVNAKNINNVPAITKIKPPPIPPIPFIQPAHMLKGVDIAENTQAPEVKPPKLPPPPPAGSFNSIQKSETFYQSETFDDNIQIDFTNFFYWVNNGLIPESNFLTTGSSIGKYIVEREIIESPLRNGKSKITVFNYYVLFENYSNIAATIVIKNGNESVLATNQEFFSSKFDSKILNAMSDANNSVISAAFKNIGTDKVWNSSVEWIKSIFKSEQILPVIANRTFGVNIFRYQPGIVDAKPSTVIRAGDILVIKNGNFSKEPLESLVITEYDANEKSFICVLISNEGKITQGIRQLNEMKKGKLRVFRPISRAFINW